MAITIETVDTKVSAMAEDIAEIKNQLFLMNGHQRADRERIVRLEERLGIFSCLGVGLSVILSSAAAWLGVRN